MTFGERCQGTTGTDTCEVSGPVSHFGFGSYVPRALALSRFAVGLSESSELFGSVVTSTMGPEQSVVKSDLHGVSREADAYGDPDVAVAHPIARSREADRAMLVDYAQDLGALSRLRWLARVLRTPVHLVVVIDQMASCMGRDDRAVVRDLEQSVD